MDCPPNKMAIVERGPLVEVRLYFACLVFRFVPIPGETRGEWMVSVYFLCLGSVTLKYRNTTGFDCKLTIFALKLCIVYYQDFSTFAEAKMNAVSKVE